MITAQEAQAIVDNSEASMNVLLEKVDTFIRREAEKGNNFACLYIDGLWTTQRLYVQSPNIPIECQRLMDRLEKPDLGYSVAYRSDGESYIPRAYDDKDETQRIINWCLVVKW